MAFPTSPVPPADLRLSAEILGSATDVIFFHLPFLSAVVPGSPWEMKLARTRHNLNIHVFILRTYKLIFSENRKQKFYSVTSGWTQPAHPVPHLKKFPG